MGRQEPCSNCPARALIEKGLHTSTELLRPDGMWLLTQASPLHWCGRDMILLSCTDITEYKRNEEALHIRSEEYRIVAQQAVSRIQRYDIRKGRITRSYDSNAYFGISTDADSPELVVQSGSIRKESVRDYLAFFADIRSGKPEGRCVLNVGAPGKAARWLQGDYTLIRDSNGAPSHAVISYRDVTEQIEQLQSEAWWNRLTVLLEKEPASVALNLTRNQIERKDVPPDSALSQIDLKISSYVEHQLPQILEEDRTKLRQFYDPQRLSTLFASGIKLDELDYRTLCGEGPVWRRASISLSQNPDTGDITGELVCTDIDRQKREQERLSYIAAHDELTGLLNRSGLRRAAEKVLNGQSGCLAFFMIDLDGFKLVNDRLGHQRGDEALRDAATAIQKVFRRTDICARLGGDEFVVLMPNATLRLAQKKAEVLVNGLHHTLGENENSIALTASVGVIWDEYGVMTFEQLYQGADLALYQAKNEGKNRYAVRNP